MNSVRRSVCKVPSCDVCEMKVERFFFCTCSLHFFPPVHPPFLLPLLSRRLVVEMQKSVHTSSPSTVSVPTHVGSRSVRKSRVSMPRCVHVHKHPHTLFLVNWDFFSTFCFLFERCLITHLHKEKRGRKMRVSYFYIILVL